MTGNQRWRERRAIFRRPDEQIRTAEYDVAELPNDREAKPFVLSHHYSASYPAARFRFGLFNHGELAGTAVFSHPTNDRTLTNVFGGRAVDSVELGRFVLLDQVPGNGETWFLARCLKLLRSHAIRGVVSFSDPVPRETSDGREIFPGHVGTIYQAANAAFLGRGKARTLRILPDGSVLSDRAMQKIRAREQGWAYSAALLTRFGAEPLSDDDDPRAWLMTWTARLTRPLRHPGNLRYAWTLDGAKLPSTGPYPKLKNLEKTSAIRSLF